MKATYFISGIQFYSAFGLDLELQKRNEEIRLNKPTQVLSSQDFKELSDKRNLFIEEELQEVSFDSTATDTTESEIVTEENHTIGFTEDSTNILFEDTTTNTFPSKDITSKKSINNVQKYKFPLFNINLFSSLNSLLKIMSLA